MLSMCVCYKEEEGSLRDFNACGRQADDTRTRHTQLPGLSV